MTWAAADLPVGIEHVSMNQVKMEHLLRDGCDNKHDMINLAEVIRYTRSTVYHECIDQNKTAMP